MDVLAPVIKADLLVLDDLGAERTSEWVQETLGLVVNTRYNERRPTIFTSNLVDSPDSTDPRSFIYQLGARTRSRLAEMCDWVEMQGVDVREVGPQRLAGLHSALAEAVARLARQPAADLGAAAEEQEHGPCAPARRRRRAVLAWRPGRYQGLAASRLRPAPSAHRPRSVKRSLHPHPVLRGDLQLLQLQSRSARRGAEATVRGGARQRDPSRA